MYSLGCWPSRKTEKNLQNFFFCNFFSKYHRFYGQKTNLVEQNVCETIRNTSLAANPKLDMSPFPFSSMIQWPPSLSPSSSSSSSSLSSSSSSSLYHDYHFDQFSPVWSQSMTYTLFTLFPILLFALVTLWKLKLNYDTDIFQLQDRLTKVTTQPTNFKLSSSPVFSLLGHSWT